VPVERCPPCEAVVSKGYVRVRPTSFNALCPDPCFLTPRPSFTNHADPSSALLTIGLASEAAHHGRRPLLKPRFAQRSEASDCPVAQAPGGFVGQAGKLRPTGP
jgi:hypothetical protein